MSFEVTTINRLTARKLLAKCGVKPEQARVMSLKQLKAHLDNFVSLGAIPGALCEMELSKAAAEQGLPANTGAPWTPMMDAELTEHFIERGQDIATLARLRGRTTGSIQARLEKLGLVPPSGNWGGRRGSGSSSNQRTVPGSFASPEQIAAMDAEMRGVDEFAEAISNAIDSAPRPTPEDSAVQGNVAPVVQAASVQPDGEYALISFVREAIRVAVNPLKGDISDTSRSVAKLASQMTGLNQVIVDTVKAEVERTRGAYQRFEIVTPHGITRTEGLAHKAFPKLLRAIAARTRHDRGALNIWLYGPAGTGKSTAARKVAEHLSLAFHTNGPVGSQWDIRGFTDAQGKVVETAFRRAWEGGGVYCWDEGDGSAPAALIEANGALATGFASFPDKVVQRHPDCIVIINGNLRPGAAPDATYNGRYKQDTAFVNRFVAIEWGIDEDLERALLGELNHVGEQWLKFIRGLRRKITERGIKGIVVSPRQAQYGLALIDAGAELGEVMEQTVKFMFTDDQWKAVAA